MKFLENPITAAPIKGVMELAGTSLLGQLVKVKQGISQSERIGRKICVKTIQIACEVRFEPGTASDAGALVHIYLVVDKQTNGAALTAGQVWSSTQPGQALRNMEYVSRFTILKHYVFRFQPTGLNVAGTGHNKTYQMWQDYVKCSIPIEYSSTTGDVSEIRHNNLCLVTGVSGAGAADNVSINGLIRIRYTDKNA